MSYLIFEVFLYLIMAVYIQELPKWLSKRFG